MRPSLILCSLLFAGCWKTGNTSSHKPAKNDVRVDLASINLGDDCGAAVTETSAKTAPVDAQDIPPGDAGRSFACIQTTMQLQIMNNGSEPTAIRVKRVELLDAGGKVLDDLTAQRPNAWEPATSTYVAWDQVAKGGAVQASYQLIGLDWNKVPGGRWEAHTKTFTLRVTVAVGDSERTVEKKATAPAMIEPDVVT
jgi:hypothetical protein